MVVCGALPQTMFLGAKTGCKMQTPHFHFMVGKRGPKPSSKKQVAVSRRFERIL
jgi:hypothetical protein